MISLERYHNTQFTTLFYGWCLLERIPYPHILLKLITIPLLFLQKDHREHNGLADILVSSAFHYLLSFPDLWHHMKDLTPNERRGEGRKRKSPVPIWVYEQIVVKTLSILQKAGGLRSSLKYRMPHHLHGLIFSLPPSSAPHHSNWLSQNDIESQNDWKEPLEVIWPSPPREN